MSTNRQSRRGTASGPFAQPRRLLQEFWLDLRYAARALALNPGFTTAAVLTVALGIGATVAVFSIVRGVLLQPLPFPEADRIVRLIENVPAEESFSGRAMRLPSMNQEEFEWWRAEATVFSRIAVTMPETRTAAFDGTLRLSGARISPALFAIRGIRPLVGRWLIEAEERPGSFVAVISEDTWRRHYASDPDVTSRYLVLDGISYAIVGVMPRAFGNDAFWTPFVIEPPRDGTVTFLAVVAQLREGISIEEAVVEANVLGSRLRGAAPGEAPPRFEIAREQDQIVAAVRPALQLLAATVVIVLLIALSFAGGVIGVALAYGAVALVSAAAVIEIPWRFRFAVGFGGETILPRVDEVSVDPTALVFAFGLSLLTGLAFGLFPALRLSRPGADVPTGRLGEKVEGSAGTRAGRVLAGVQLSLATSLLVGAGLLVHSFVNITSLELGFDLNTQIFQLVAPGELPPSRRLALALEVERRIASSSRVEAAGFTNMQPLEADDDGTGIVPLGPEVDRANPSDENRSEIRSVTPGYLHALGVRLVEGRWLDERDARSETRALLVNNAWVRKFSPERSPVGMTVYSLCRVLGGRCTDTPYEIVGVIEDIRLRMDGGAGAPVGGLPRTELPKVVIESLERSVPPPSVLDGSRQAEMGGRGTAGDASGLSFAVRVRGTPLSLADLRNIVTEVDASLAVDGFATMREVVSAITARPRFYATALTLFAGIAAFIAAVGVYGVLSYAVSQRTHEFGVRLALGAAPREVLALALRQGLIVVAVGIPAGIVAAMALTRSLSSLLFGITPLDLSTYGAVAVAFGALAMLASYLPARRAARVDPVIMLRTE